MTTLLVANRGEVARRIFRTARAMGIRTVAVYSEADASAPYVAEADEAVLIGPPSAAESYLLIDRIIGAAKQTGADLIHPGYGFLAEDAEFAEACQTAGVTFVGPTPEVLRILGAKDEARRLAERIGVPVAPGYSGEDQSDEAFRRAAEAIGYPVMVKPSEGGGGKGMAVARDPEQLQPALDSARRVALAAFGDDRLMLESYLTEARHVEVQILGDSHGNVLHFGTRDCSLQRRHQKIVEEAPAPAADEITEVLTSSAVALAEEVGYRSAGTVEFLVAGDGTASFLEVNARLQVEHPVTEEVCGVDLVELQLKVAAGEALPLSQTDVTFDGHAIEARIYAEDPEEGYLPQAGRLVHLRWPEEVRVDSGVEKGSEVSTHYDPMVAKVVAHGPDRQQALARLRKSLEETEILGVRTNLGLLRAVLADPMVAGAEVTTSWLEEAYGGWRTRPEQTPDEVVAIAAAAEADRLRRRPSKDPWVSVGAWRTTSRDRLEVLLRPEGRETAVTVVGEVPFGVGERWLEPGDRQGVWIIEGREAIAARGPDGWFVQWEGVHHEIPVGAAERRPGEAAAAHLDAPMPGQVIAVRVAEGDEVTKGQELVVVEAMKMEHTIKAPADGVVVAVLCTVGQQVDRGQTLVDFDPAETEG